MTESWEPSYGFCATNETNVHALAMTLEALRRRLCAYGGGNRCDCKYGLTVDESISPAEFGFAADDNGVRGTRWDNKNNMHIKTKVGMGTEQTGCPELREMIHRLLHRDTPLM